MKDYYKHVRECIDTYNKIQDKMHCSQYDTTEDEDEFIINHCMHLAHALIKDAGYGEQSREELSKVCNIIQDVI